MKQLFLVILALGITLTINAQDRAPSPASKVEQKVGLTDITVEFSRPGLKDRTVFADGSPLAPLGELWRTGANSATKVTFSDNVKVEGKDVAAGSYALLTIPSETTWTINLYPYESTRWTSYREATPVVTANVAPGKIDASIESFMINFDQLRDYSASMVLGWGNTVVSVGITVN